jgi:hypothetical protein
MASALIAASRTEGLLHAVLQAILSDERTRGLCGQFQTSSGLTVRVSRSAVWTGCAGDETDDAGLEREWGFLEGLAWVMGVTCNCVDRLMNQAASTVPAKNRRNFGESLVAPCCRRVF